MKLVVELENPCEVSWLKDNRPLDPKRDGVKIETGKGNRYLLTLPKASVTDSGIYSLRAQSKTNKKQFSTTNCNVVVRGIYISCMQKNLLNCELDFQSPKTKQKKILSCGASVVMVTSNYMIARSNRTCAAIYKVSSCKIAIA